MPVTNTYNLGRPKFVADEGSVMLLGTGGQIDWSAVAADADGIKRLPAGTLMHQAAGGLWEPSDGVTNLKAASGILQQGADDSWGQNKGFHGVYIGGHFYGNLLPTEPVAQDLTNLGARFVFQTYADNRVA